MTPLPVGNTSSDHSADRNSVAGVIHRLDEGWQIEQPVYVMADPAQRGQIVFRIVLWRDGRPQVVTVGDGAEIRQFVADRHLRQEPL
jgi:hypothetical protein